jgi:hypothetical protein
MNALRALANSLRKNWEEKQAEQREIEAEQNS